MLRRNTRRILKLSIILFICGFVFHIIVTFKDIENNRIKTEEKYSRLPKDPNQQKADEKVDWHDYNQIELESKRKGPGEQGAAFYVPPGNEKRKKELYKINGYNALASDFIAIDRSLPDVRHKDCKKKKYLRNLPSVSIIVPFYNEHLSTFMRTVTSAINRAPPHLIIEVILVDDFSTREELKGELEKYIREHLPKVRIIRANKREGLIRAKLIGAKAAVGDVLIFLDSHTEANVNWLPPLLEPIAKDRKTVVCPLIDWIKYETFAYKADDRARGSFDWTLYYKRLPLLSEDLAHPTELYKSPVMIGGLFAIDRSYFWELGGYDEGLDIWGGEQYELSFKIWQCGGQLVDAPCSRFGHLYRKFHPYRNSGREYFIAKNYKRVAEVWMDEYKEYLYLRNPHYRKLDPGDISQQKALRERLKCKSFKWFMEEINFDQPKIYPPFEPPNFASGEIRNVATNLCIDTRFRDRNESFGLEKCIKDHGSHGGEQQFILTWRKDIKPKKRDIFCFDVHSSDNHAPVVLWLCHLMQGNQEWKYNYEDMQLHHRATNRCLDCDAERKEIFMNSCDTSLKTQRWKFEVVNKTAIDNWR